MQVAVDPGEQATRREAADLVEAIDDGVSRIPEWIERRLLPGEALIELGGHGIRPGIERFLVQRRRRHIAARRPRRHGDVHLRDHLADAHRLGEERGILVIDESAALRRIAGPCRLRVGIQVAQRRERKRPPLGAVVQEGLHDHERRRRLVAAFPHPATEHRREVLESRGLQDVGHLELLRWSRLDAAQMFEEDRVAHLDRRVALLHPQQPHRRQVAGVERLGIRARETQSPAGRAQHELVANRAEQPFDVRRSHRPRHRGRSDSAPAPTGS